MVRAISTATTNVQTPIRRQTPGALSPSASCSTATIMVPPTMKAALSTLTAAMTRARRSAPAQACTAAKVGTM